MGLEVQRRMTCPGTRGAFAQGQDDHDRNQDVNLAGGRAGGYKAEYQGTAQWEPWGHLKTPADGCQNRSQTAASER